MKAARLVWLAFFIFWGGCLAQAQVTTSCESPVLVPPERFVVPHLAFGGGDFIRLSDGVVVGQSDLQVGERYILAKGWEMFLVFENNSDFGVSFANCFFGSDGRPLLGGLLLFTADGKYIGTTADNFATGLASGVATGTIIATPNAASGWGLTRVFSGEKGGQPPPGGKLDVHVSAYYRYRRNGVATNESLVRSTNAVDLGTSYAAYFDRLTSSQLVQTTEGVAITNPTDQAAVVQVSADQFSSHYGTITFTIPPRGEKIGMLDDFGFSFPPDSEGLITVKSVNGLQLGFIALHVNKNPDDLIGFTIATVDGSPPVK